MEKTLTSRLTHRLRSIVAKAGVQALRLSGFYEGYWRHWRGELFDYAERHGLHVLPVHYYTPIPAQADFSRGRRRNGMAGIELDIPAGLARATALLDKYEAPIASLLKGPGDYDRNSSSFHPLDAAILYATVRELRPERIIEIGSGMSTFVILGALRDAGMTDTVFTCIEPFLPDYLKSKRGGIAEIIERPLQEVALERFQELEAGDILFIDSTHVVRFGSDVVYEILDILPLLKPGVVIHVHDIFFPDDYPQAWLQRYRFFWSEQYMLQAFLCMNPNFRIDIPVHAIERELPADELLIPPGSNVPPASLWMRRI